MTTQAKNGQQVTGDSIFLGGWWLGRADVDNGRERRTTGEIVEQIREWAGRPLTWDEQAGACNGYGDGWTGDMWRKELTEYAQAVRYAHHNTTAPGPCRECDRTIGQHYLERFGKPGTEKETTCAECGIEPDRLYLMADGRIRDLCSDCWKAAWVALGGQLPPEQVVKGQA